MIINDVIMYNREVEIVFVGEIKKHWPAGSKGIAEIAEAKQQIIRATLANWRRKTSYMGGLICLGGNVTLFLFTKDIMQTIKFQQHTKTFNLNAGDWSKFTNAMIGMLKIILS